MYEMSSTNTGQRAFAQKLSRYQAADVRRRIAATASFASGEKSDPFNRISSRPVSGLLTGISASQNANRETSLDPPDYEELLEQNFDVLIGDPLCDVLKFPDDDVEVVCVPRRCRTVVPLLPELDPQVWLANPRLNDCVRSYTRDWVAVHRRYQQHSSSLVSPRQSYERMTVLNPPKRQEYEIDLIQTSGFDEDEDDDRGCQNSTSTSNSCRSSIQVDEETPRGSWASSIFDLRNSVADPLITGILDSTLVPKNSSILDSPKQHGRHEMLFSLYPPPALEEPLEKRLPADIPSEHTGHKILVKIHHLKLDLEVEPIFASMALYDVKERKKISENFYFDLNSDVLKLLLGPHLKAQDASTFAKSCVFDLSCPSPDIYLIIRLEKVLQGDINECVEPYMKDDKNREKVKANAVAACERLGRYRMPFAWTYISLMHVINPNTAASSSQSSGGTLDSRDSGSDKSSANSSLERKTSASQKDYPAPDVPQKPRKIGSCGGLLDETGSNYTKKNTLERSASTRQSGTLSSVGGLSTTSMSTTGTVEKRTVWTSDDVALALDSFRAVTLTMTSFFKQEPDKMREEDLYKILHDYRRHAAHKRLKSIPGSLKMEFSPCPHELPHMVTPELAKLKPYPDPHAIPTKEVLEFRPRDLYAPNYSYRNILFIYPREVNLTNRPGGSARNIACQVEYRVGETEDCALSVIFGKSSSPELEKQARTSVTYHNRSPCFYDEFKIKVPAKLDDKHHLFFTFYHVSCQKKEAQNQVETPVGYTWLPLIRDGGLVSGEINLPVMIDQPPKDYSIVGPEVQVPHYKWVDNHKNVFTINVRPVTTVHSLDRHIDRFLNLCSEIERGEPLPRYLHGEGNAERELKTSIEELRLSALDALVSFLPIVLDKLLLNIVRPPRIGTQELKLSQPCFEAMGVIAQRVSMNLEGQSDHLGRNQLLSTYVSYEATLPHPGTAPLQTYSPTRGPNFRTWENPGAVVAGLEHRTAGVYRQMSSFDSSVVQDEPGTQSVRKLVHEEIALQWVVSSGTARDLALTNSWFFLELMVKSMTEHLRTCGGLTGVSRKNRFPEQFTDDVTNLVTSLTSDVIAKFNRDGRDLKAVSRLNSSLAFFIQDLLSIMDRGYVFGLIRDYCKRLDTKISSLPDAGYLLTYKLDFLRIVCSHEHVIALNLPFGTPLCPPNLHCGRGSASSPTPSVSSQSSWVSTIVGGTGNKWIYADLSPEYKQHHFLAGLILSNLQVALESAHSPAVHSRAVETLRNLLWCHDVDTRFTNEKVANYEGIRCSTKSRVACLYLPLLGIVLDAIAQLHRPSNEGTKFCRAFTRNKVNRGSMHANRSVAIGSPDDGDSDRSDALSRLDGVGQRSPLSVESTKHLLVCLLWVLKNVESSLLRAWWCEMPVGRLKELLDVLHIAVSCFEYCGRRALKQAQASFRKPHGGGDMKSRLEEMILGGHGSARLELIRRKNTQASPGLDTRDSGAVSLPSVPSGSSSPMPSLRWHKDQWRTPLASTTGSEASTVVASAQQSPSGSDSDAAVLGNLSAECMLVILDTLEIVAQVATSHSAESSAQALLGEVLKVLLHALSRNQATSVLCALFGFQRNLLVKFPNLIFEEDSEFCADLCLQLLSHCGSGISTVRAQAAASLYALMRQNFEIGNNFARVKMQVTMSLSSLVGTSTAFNEDFLRRSLKTILTYAEEDTESHEDYSSFPEQVRDLVFNLHMILSDTVKMKEYQQDPEMLLDLMYRIAKGYQNSPDLRLTWLANMAQNHSKQGNHAEAAMCLVHSAALVSEYLLMIEDKLYMPRGAVAFESVSPNVSEESAVSDDVVSPDDQGGTGASGGGIGGGSCSGKYFTEAGLCGLIEQAANSFNAAGMYESIDRVYKVLLPIVESSHDYKKLSNIHGKLREAYERIDQLHGKRVFGTYFRVGFYGAAFGDLDGEEFVYKEPPLTKLSEISDRLETFYAERFGTEKVVIVKDSNPVNPKKLIPDKAYIQITYVEPYFESYEERRRLTSFHLNDCLKNFIFSTPFTRDPNRPHGELHEQHKRKTIVTTQSHFPYVKTRIPVIAKRSVTLSPAEVAIEDIQKKCTELAAATNQNPPDPKILQMVLQGCIGTTVNQGPLEVAHVFLSDLKDGVKTPTKLQNKLRLCFKDFSRKCSDALNKNKNLIGPDQRDYQRELENNYKNFVSQLAPMITISRPGGGISEPDANQRLWKHISALPGKEMDGFHAIRSSPVV